MMSKIIFLELNEVPNNVFVKSFSENTFLKKKLSSFHYQPTITRDEGHLSPWVTWPTIHRGVTDAKHKIEDINLSTLETEEKYPSLWTTLSKKGYKVGVFGSFHSSKIRDFDNYSFVVPDSFSESFKCKPKSMNGLQRLNNIMSRRSARIVDSSLPNLFILKDAVISYIKHSYQFRAFFCTIRQLFIEIFMPWTNVRRRTLQADILFDAFMSCLIRDKPDFCTFFTNHVASSMHRFWEASFPNDYKVQINTDEWINTYKNEIKFSMQSTAYFINQLTKFVDKNDDYQLWVISSMGQKAEQDYEPEGFFWDICSCKDFFSSLCNEELILKENPQMIPHYSIKADSIVINKIVSSLKKIESNSKFWLRNSDKNSLTLFFDASNLDKLIFKDKITREIIKVRGIKKRIIKENTGSSAYHTPHGIIYMYGKKTKPFQINMLDENGFLPTDKIKSHVFSLLEND